jgi:glycosyltransferase involved in cell wall biosynthesis
MIGQIDYAVLEDLKRYQLEKFVKQITYKPHDELMSAAANACVFLLPLNNTPNVKGITPGKLYEYMALKRPVFCIGPEDGDSAQIIRECNAGITVNFEDIGKMKTELLSFFEDYSSGKEIWELNEKNTINYSRPELTRKMARLLDEMIGEE